MKLFQPTVHPLPTGINLAGKTAVITGATAGIGLETARQLLSLNVSTLVLAVRNTAKGEACAKDLQRSINNGSSAEIIVLELDMDRYDSIIQFTATLIKQVPVVDILILNAGIGMFNFEQSPATGHERTVQVNYLSNVLLLTQLLPYLETSAEKTGSATRVTWVGSRTHELAISVEKNPIETGKSILGHFDAKETFSPYKQYGDSKLLAVLFMYELAPRLSSEKIIFNMVCPGMVNTSMSDMLPFPMRVIMNLVKAIRARSVEVGGWIILNAAVVAGAESHGRFFGDKNIQEPSGYIQSKTGQEMQKKLWIETVGEMKKLTKLPAEFL